MDGLAPDAVSVLDMQGNLLNRPRRPASGDGQEPSEGVLEFRHNMEHELLTCDVRGDMAHHRDHRYWEFVFEIEHPEIVLPDHVPALGLGPLGSLHDNLLRRTA